MLDLNDPSTWPSPRGPWPEVTDLSRLFDYGRPWCMHADGHPDRVRDYPDLQQHLPWHECRGPEWSADGACRELDGDSIELSFYAASPFRFGSLRSEENQTATTRLVVDLYWRDATGADVAGRVSVPIAEALRVARILRHICDAATFTPNTVRSTCS